MECAAGRWFGFHADMLLSFDFCFGGIEIFLVFVEFRLLELSFSMRKFVS